MLCWIAFLDCTNLILMLVLANKRSVFAPPLQTPNSAVQNNPTQSFAQPQIGLTAICTAPEIFHNVCFKFPLGITVSQEKLKTMLMQNCGGQTMCIMGDGQMVNKPALELDNGTILVSSSSCRERSAVSYFRRGGLWPTWSREKGAKNILYCDNQDKQRVTIHWKRWQGNTLAF